MPPVATFRRISIVLGFVLALGACKKSSSLHDYPDSLEGFQRLADDLKDAARRGDKSTVGKMAERFALPDPARWFAATFGDEAGKRLLAEYQENHMAEFGTAAPEILDQLVRVEGRITVEARRHDRTTDPTATGYQVEVLRAAKVPLAVYTLRFWSFASPDDAFSLWSFVYVDGGFRLAGKMKTASAVPVPHDIDQLSELPVESARRVLRELEQKTP